MRDTQRSSLPSSYWYLRFGAGCDDSRPCRNPGARDWDPPAKERQGRRQQLGLPNEDVFYQDHHGQPMPARVLHSRISGVRGKPDCLIRTPEGIIPVELKKSAHPPARGGAYPNHLIQVLAYIVLVREQYGEQVPMGWSHTEARPPGR